MTTVTHPPQFHPPPHSHASQVRLASGLNVLVGIYLLIAGAIGGVTRGSTTNAIILGIIVAILAASRAFGSAGPWVAWINALIGIWMIISPWIYGYAGHGWMWNSIVVGIIMLALGIWSATAGGTARSQPPM